MTEKIQLADQEKVRQGVDNYVDYLWLMRSFEEELAKEAEELVQGFKAHKRRADRFKAVKSN